MSMRKPTEDAKSNDEVLLENASQIEGYFLIDPRDERLVIDETLNTSRKTKYTESQIKHFAEVSLAYGQIYPVTVRPADIEGEKKLVLTEGFQRALGGKYRAEHIDPDFKLKVLVRPDLDIVTGKVRNAIENHHRFETNAADDAEAIVDMQDQHGISDDQLAIIFNKPVASIRKLKGLNKLPPKYRDQIRRGILPPTVAFDALRVPDEEERHKALDKLIEEAKGAGEGAEKRVQVRSARKVFERAVQRIQERKEQREREKKAGGRGSTRTQKGAGKTTAAAEPPPKANGKPKKDKATVVAYAKDLKEVRDFFENIAGSPVMPDVVNAFGKVALDWMKGKLKAKDGDPDDQVEAALEAVFLASPEGQKNGNKDDVSKGWRGPHSIT